MFGLFGSGKVRQGGSGANVKADGSSVDLVLYKYDSCPFCRRVYRTIDQLGVNVEYRDIRSDFTHRQALLAKTGRATVPCLYIDGEPMFESADIMRWLEGQFQR
ncbi:MAG: glutathione S-transferase N-terminal domain-containing protein [Proteobacteria bacterium]|nr:glutathione S-transferase N-terminal domain-containing protein [Pseudomonadota bacterium]